MNPAENWYITGLDVKTAFLYRKLNKEIYMKQPEGFTTRGQGSKVMHLLCALYGLKQATCNGGESSKPS